MTDINRTGLEEEDYVWLSQDLHEMSDCELKLLFTYVRMYNTEPEAVLEGFLGCKSLHWYLIERLEEIEFEELFLESIYKLFTLSTIDNNQAVVISDRMNCPNIEGWVDLQEDQALYRFIRDEIDADCEFIDAEGNRMLLNDEREAYEWLSQNLHEMSDCELELLFSYARMYEESEDELAGFLGCKSLHWYLRKRLDEIKFEEFFTWRDEDNSVCCSLYTLSTTDNNQGVAVSDHISGLAIEGRIDLLDDQAFDRIRREIDTDLSC